MSLYLGTHLPSYPQSLSSPFKLFLFDGLKKKQEFFAKSQSDGTVCMGGGERTASILLRRDFVCRRHEVERHMKLTLGPVLALPGAKKKGY